MPSPTDSRLKGSTAFVTGGATGLGNALCEALLASGVRVAATYRPGGHVQGLESLRSAYGDQITGYPCDLADSDDVQSVFARARNDLGGIRMLVNNAGIWLSGRVEEIPVADWDTTFAVNARAPFLLCKGFLAQGEPGKIVNITSQAAFHGSTSGHAHYAASKAALVAMTVSLARENADRGVNANCVAIGMMRSNLVKEALARNEGAYLDRIPIGRVADPSDIVGAVMFLLGPDSNYMTGATLDVTGGMLMR